MRIERFKVMFTLNGKRVSDSRRQFLKIENEQTNTVQLIYCLLIFGRNNEQ